jgi:predicted cupin superfamily sugar epimerase
VRAVSADRVAELIRMLELAPHPEGGHYREIFRSERRVSADGDDRSALTSIYFLLTAGEHSAWHVVRSDEAWHFYEGEPLELLVVDPETMDLRRLILGPAAPGEKPVAVVPAGHWQAARPLGAFALAGCSVGPGFEFEDFAMLRDRPDDAARLRDALPVDVNLL